MIKATLKALGHNGAWLATQLGCDRTYIYKVFAKDTIDTALLLKISLLLNHNFFDLFTEEWAHKIAEAPQAQPASNIKLP